MSTDNNDRGATAVMSTEALKFLDWIHQLEPGESLEVNGPGERAVAQELCDAGLATLTPVEPEDDVFRGWLAPAPS